MSSACLVLSGDGVQIGHSVAPASVPEVPGDGRPDVAARTGASTASTTQQAIIAATPVAQTVSHFARRTLVRRPSWASSDRMVRDPHSPPQCPPETRAISSRPGSEASMPAAT